MDATTANQNVALVTGASSGMGKAFAKALVAEGLTVYAASRRLEQMSDLVQLGAVALRMDITRDDEVQAAVQRIEQDHGGVDVLVNNAGFGIYGAMEDTSIEDARYQFEVNLFGMARLTQLLLPAMRRKRAGKIINISPMGGKMYVVSGNRSRSVHPADRRLGDARADDQGAGDRCAAHGVVPSPPTGAGSSPDRATKCSMTVEAACRIGMPATMSRKGNCWDNATSESFFNSLKNERVHGTRYETRDEARADLFDYVEIFYNRRRRHSALGGQSPAAVYEAWLKNQSESKLAA